jgi:hypothetical protein
MRTHVPPRPTIEASWLDVRNVVGNEIVAQSIPLIHRTRQFSRLRIHGNSASSIANAVGVDAQFAI